MMKGLLYSLNQNRLEVIRNYFSFNYKDQITLTCVSSIDLLGATMMDVKPDVLLLDLLDINLELLNLCSSLLPKNSTIWIVVTDNISEHDEGENLSKPLLTNRDHQDIYFFKWVRQQKEPINSNKEKLIDNNNSNSTNIFSLKKMAIPTLEGLLFINTDEIIRLEAKGVYTQIIISNGQKLTSSKNLGEYEQLLQGFPFFRIHQSHLINLNKMLKYQKGRGGVIHMEDGSLLEVASRRRNEFIHIFEQNS